jgi:hypothetical protein
MKRHLAIAAAALGFAFMASGAHALTGFEDPVCGFEHPKKAKEVKGSLVQAFVSCGNPGGNPINDTTESNTQSCSPPETYAEQSGNSPNDWHWDHEKGQGTVSFKAAKNKIESPANLNPEDDTADVAVSLKLQGIVDISAAPDGASGTGAIATLSRATLRDRQGTGGDNSDDQPMTVIDFPVSFPFDLIDGKANLKTTANALLNPANIGSLPKCTSIEVVDITVFDEEDNVFAHMGTFLPAN